MAGEQILLDPNSEITGTQLDITDNTLGYFLVAHDYPTPDDEPQWASSADTEGELRASTRPRNRTITATVRCIEPSGGSPSFTTIIDTLQQKVAKLNREGGTLRRIVPPSSFKMTFDVVAASLQVPVDKRSLVRRAADVTLQFTCRPYGRGEPVTLNSHTAPDTKAPLVFTETVSLTGDVPGLGSLVIENATNAKTYGAWGVQSRYASTASANALLFQAESGSTATNVAPAAGPAGASGAGTNKVMSLTDVGTTGREFDINGGSAMQHIGSFRVLVRLQASGANTGIASARFKWNKAGAVQIPNDWVPVQTAAGAAIKGSWVLLDLGLISLSSPRPQIGVTVTNAWHGSLAVKSTVGTDDVDVDWIALIPIDEGSAVFTNDDGVGLDTTQQLVVTNERVDVVFGGISWPPISYEGDYLLVPPNGLEVRQPRFIVLLTGTAGGNLTDTLVDATNLDAIKATLTYTPRYLVVPSA